MRSRPRLENGGRKKKNSRFHYLPVPGGDKKRVCLRFLCNVFCISFKILDSVLADTSDGVYIGMNKHLGMKPAHAASEDAVFHVRKHINSFPRMPLHYCRHDSKRLYLTPELTAAELYRLHIKKYCVRHG